MANTEAIKTTITIDGKSIILFNDTKVDVHYIDEIFDPDKPVSGKYFPTIYSIVIDGQGNVWYVSARDETTYRSTLKPIHLVTSEDDEDTVKIISYGNDKYCLYQDTRVSPYKLVCDAKILFYGNNLKEFELIHNDDEGNQEIISMYLDSNDSFVTSRIPLAPISSEYHAYKFPTNCHTTVDLVEGEPVTMNVYNNLGNIAATLTIYVRNGVWLNDLQSRTNPIVALDAECLQTVGSDFYVKERQDPAHLNIRPYLLYADGAKSYIPIDNKQCFLYGLEYFVPSYPGYSQTLIIKYFLNYRETSTVHTTVNNIKFISCTKKLLVVKDKEDYSFKLTAIPKFNLASQSWELHFFLYTDDRESCYDVDDYVTYDDGFNFDGSNAKWGYEQRVMVNYDFQHVLDTTDPLTGTQVFYVTVNHPNNYERYTFRENKDSEIVYGGDSALSRRPVIWYDSSISKYFIPTSIFHNKEAVIESFYRKACPFYDTRTETEAPTPTHFVIRDPVSGQQLISAPIDLNNYGVAFTMLMGTPSLSNSTVLVEFEQLLDGTYLLLYGVPVDIRTGEFNDEDSDVDYGGQSMKIYIKSKFDDATGEYVITSFSCLPNSHPLVKQRRLLPVGELVIDGTAVPKSFYTEWFRYRVEPATDSIVWSTRQNAKQRS